MWPFGLPALSWTQPSCRRQMPLAKPLAVLRKKAAPTPVAAAAAAKGGNAALAASTE